SLAVAAGHAGFDPADPQRLVDHPIDWPSIEAWRAALESSPWVARPDTGDAESAADAPLVYEHGLVYLRRYREYARRLAVGIHRIGSATPKSPGPALPAAEGEDARRADGGTLAPPTEDLQSEAITAA